jgi:hypothetical protein
MQFGGWNVTENSIEWNGKGSQRFVIPANELNSTRPGNTYNPVFYKWILLATDEEWLTQNDLYDLNYAYVFAAGKLGLDFNYDIFDATLAYQYELFEAEDEEDLES